MLPMTEKDLVALEKLMTDAQDGPIRVIVLSLIAEIRRLQKK